MPLRGWRARGGVALIAVMTHRFYSQHRQDQIVYETFFRDARPGDFPGVFVDVGAYDGATFSNSLFFEETLGWRGLCVEPLPEAFAKLAARRRAISVNCGVSDYEGTANFLDVEIAGFEKMYSGLVKNYDKRHSEFIEQRATKKRVIKVPVRRLSAILAEHGIAEVDYCSIDTEGSELAILSDLMAAPVKIRVLTVENNYRDIAIPTLLTQRGYRFSALEGFDELYALAELTA